MSKLKTIFCGEDDGQAITSLALPYVRSKQKKRIVEKEDPFT